MIYIVGIGPGDKKYLTLKAIDIINSADIVVGSKRALNLFDIDDKKKIILGKNIIEELKDIIKKYKDKNIAILSTGDPGFSGLLKTIKKIGIDLNNIEVIPGISSIQVAAAKLKISWEDFEIITLHGKPENLEILSILLKNNKKVIFLPNKLNEDAKKLISLGVNENIYLYVLENLTYDNERIRKLKLKDIVNKDFSYLTVCLYLPT